MLAVLAHYNSSHGEAVALALLVEDTPAGLVEAVDCAVNIEELGYEFSGSDIGAYVVRVLPGYQVRKNTGDYVFIHRYYMNEWRQEWFDEVAKGRYLKAKGQPV